MEQQFRSDGKNKIIFSLVSIIILLLLGAYWLFLSEKVVAPEVDNYPVSNIPIQEKSFTGTSSQGIPATITWNILNILKPIKTIKALSLGGYDMQVFNIGSIVGGEYSGKVLALGIIKDSDQEFSAMSFSTSVYFLSDEKGNLVAWDKSFINNPDDRCLNSAGVLGCESFYSMVQQLGLSDNLQRSLDFIPKELKNTNYITNTEKHAYFKINIYSHLVPIEVNSQEGQLVDKTESGFKVFKTNIDDTQYPFPNVESLSSYYIALPFGVKIEISPEPDFVDQNDVPKLFWSAGKKLVSSYRYGEYAYGWQDCYEGISADQFQSSLVQTGTSVNGDPLFEIDSERYPKVYQCLFEKTKRYVYDPTTQTGSYQDTISYDDFVPSHPMFFWKHQLGDLIAFIRSDVVPAAEKAKPVIYLYPEKQEKVSVKVFPIGGFLRTDPDYGNGWVVDASPDGQMTNTKDGRRYPYLFWEGGKDGVVETPKQGFVVAKNDVSFILKEKLSLFGLNEKETKDFIDFWSLKLSSAPYYFITFISRSEIDRVSPMSIFPKPDTVIRVLMDYKPLIKPISVESLNITKIKRNGFTAVEWGGIVRD